MNEWIPTRMNFIINDNFIISDLKNDLMAELDKLDKKTTDYNKYYNDTIQNIDYYIKEKLEQLTELKDWYNNKVLFLSIYY